MLKSKIFLSMGLLMILSGAHVLGTEGNSDIYSAIEGNPHTYKTQEAIQATKDYIENPSNENYQRMLQVTSKRGISTAHISSLVAIANPEIFIPYLLEQAEQGKLKVLTIVREIDALTRHPNYATWEKAEGEGLQMYSEKLLKKVFHYNVSHHISFKDNYADSDAQSILRGIIARNGNQKTPEIQQLTKDFETIFGTEFKG